MLFYVFFISNSNAEWSENRYNNEISKAGIYSFFAEFRNNKLDYKTFYSSISDEEAFKLVRTNLKEDNEWFKKQATINEYIQPALQLYFKNSNVDPSGER